MAVVWLAPSLPNVDDVLKRAIKRTVVRAGADTLLGLPPIDRYFKRAYASALAKLGPESGCDEAPEPAP
jgi:hypothetical protein